jgi:hypothetical protein
MSGVYLSYPVYASMAYAGTTLPFLLSFLLLIKFFFVSEFVMRMFMRFVFWFVVKGIRNLKDF